MRYGKTGIHNVKTQPCHCKKSCTLHTHPYAHIWFHNISQIAKNKWNLGMIWFTVPLSNIILLKTLTSGLYCYIFAFIVFILGSNLQERHSTGKEGSKGIKTLIFKMAEQLSWEHCAIMKNRHLCLAFLIIKNLHVPFEHTNNRANVQLGTMDFTERASVPPLSQISRDEIYSPVRYIKPSTGRKTENESGSLFQKDFLQHSHSDLCGFCYFCLPMGLLYSVCLLWVYGLSMHKSQNKLQE